MEWILICVTAFVFMIFYECRYRLKINHQLMQAEIALQQAQHEAKDFQNQLMALQRLNHETILQETDVILTRSGFEENFRQTLSESARHELQFGVLLVRVVNQITFSQSLTADQFKHLIREISLKLKNAIREEDSIGQFSELTFALILRNIQRRDSIAIVAKRLIDAFNESIRLDEFMIPIHLHIGISIFPETGCDALSLFQGAESVLSHMEKESRSMYKFSQGDLNQQTNFHKQLHECFMRDRFFSECQFDCVKHEDSTGRSVYRIILSFASQCISESQILPFLERYGKFQAYLEKVISIFSDKVKSNPGVFFGFPLLESAVKNLNFIQDLPKWIKQYGLEPAQCVWFFSSSSLVGDISVLAKGMNRLRYLGCKMGLEDFAEKQWDFSIFNYANIDFVCLSDQALKNEKGENILLAHFMQLSKELGFSILSPT